MKVHHNSMHGESLSVTEFECSFCGDVFERQQSDVLGEHQFCDTECHGKWESETMTGSDNPVWNSVSRTCKQCGESFYEQKAKVKRGQGVFCSYDCSGIWQSENLSGEDNPNWQGGHNHDARYYGRTWSKRRKSAIKRACGVCESPFCEKRESCHGVALDVHHIVPWELFNDTEEANDLSNLIVLCREHHKKIEPVG